jgi:Protein of unknown function (DUF2971)
MEELLDKLNNLNKTDEFIFHYTKTQIAIENIIPSMKLKFSSFTFANDPLEFMGLQASFSEMIGGSDPEMYIKHREKVVNILKDIKFSSFCIDDIPVRSGFFHKGYARSRMWAQYSDKHSGVCLIFDKYKLLNSVNKKTEKMEITKTFNGNVRYVDFGDTGRKITDLFDDFDINISVIDILIKKEDLYLTKDIEFKDEQEFRIGIYNPSPSFKEKSHIYVPINNALIGIVLGVNCPEAYNPCFIKIRKSFNINIYKMHWRNGEPILLDNPFLEVF